MKRTVGIDIGSYTFNTSERQITFSGISSLVLSQFLLITNTTRNIIIYNFADQNNGATSFTQSESTYILTLKYDTTSMEDTDSLQIFIEVSDNTEDQLILLRKILTVLESNAVVDYKRRQKVIIDVIGTTVATGLATEITTTIPVTGTFGTSLASGGQGPTVSFPTLATTVYQPVWEGPVDQRWRVIDEARIAFANGIRNNLIFDEDLS